MGKKDNNSDKTMLGGRYYTKDEREKAIQNAIKSAEQGQYKEAGQLKGGSVKEAPKKQKYKAKDAGKNPLQPIKVNTAQTLADVASGKSQGTQEAKKEQTPETKFSEEANNGKRRSNSEYQKQKRKTFTEEANEKTPTITQMAGKIGEKPKPASPDKEPKSDELEEPNYKPDDGDVVWDSDPATKQNELANISEEDRNKLIQQYNDAVEKERTASAWATDDLGRAAAEEAARERDALEEQIKDINRAQGKEVYTDLADEAQSRDLFEGWAGERVAGDAAALGSALEWFDKASDDMVRYEYDLEHGEGAYDRAIAGKNVNQLTDLGSSLFQASKGWQEQAQEDWASGTEDMSELGKQAAGIGKTAADMTMDMIENFIIPGAGRVAMASRVAGQGALTQDERENNDIDTRMAKAAFDGATAFLSEYLMGGAEAVYGKSVLGGKITESLGKGIKNPYLRKALLNTEGLEEGLEYVLGYAGDKILGFDQDGEFRNNELLQNMAVGYIMGVLFNGIAGGLNYDAKKLRAVADEAIMAAQMGITPEEAAQQARLEPDENVKITPREETEAEPDITPGAEMPQTEPAAQPSNGAWEGWSGWVQETLSGGPISDEDIDAIYRRDAARQAFEEITGVSLDGMTEEEAKATIGMAAGTTNTGPVSVPATEQNTATEPTAETEQATPEINANEMPLGAEPAQEANDTTGEIPNQEQENTNENAGQNETAGEQQNPNQGQQNQQNQQGNQEQKKKTDHTKKTTNPNEETDAEFDKLNKKYGSIEKGENPARDINVPKKDAKGNKVGEGARTIFEADATPEERVASLKAAVVNGNFGHVPVTNDARSKNAVTKLAKDGWSRSASDFLAAVNVGKVDADTIAMGAHLLNEAGNSPDASGKLYVELAMAYNDAVSGTGQALAAARILKTLTPEGKLYGMEKTIEKMNKDIRKNNAKKKAGKQTAEIKLDEKLVEDYLKAKTDEERNEIHDKLVKDAAKQVPNTFRDKFTALRYLNMLGNFKTQVRNLAGNTGMTIVQKVKNEARGGIEGIVKAASGGKYDRQYKGGIGLAKRLKVASEDFVSDKDLQALAMGEKKFSDVAKQSEAEILDAKKPFSTKNPVGMFLNLYSDLTGKAMELGDLIFVRANYADALAGYLNAHDISAADWKAMVADPNKSAEVDKARQFAIKQAQEATFRDTNAVSKFASTFDSRWPGLAKKVSQGVIPFRKTPANVLMRMEEYSPLGSINTIVKGVQAAKGTAEVSDVIDSFAKSATGSGLAYLGYLLASMRMARTKDDDEKEEALAKLRGQQDYSVEVGGTSVTMDWLSPASAPFFMGVEAYNLAKDGNFRPAEFFDVAMSLTNPMLEMSMLSGVNDALNNLSEFEGDNSAIAQFVLNSAWSYLTQGISNTMLGQIEQFSEKNRQTYYTEKDNPLLPTWAQKKLAKLGNKTPGVDYQSADYIDAWGRKQANDPNLGTRAWNTFLNPGYVSKMDQKATEVDALIADLYEYGKEQTDHDTFPNVVPKTPSRSTTVNGVKLTPEEYEEYAITKGQESLNAIIEASQTEAFQNADEYTQAETIKDIYAYSEFLAAAKIAEERGEEYYNDTYSPLLTGQKEDGEDTFKTPIKEDDIPEYLAYKNTYDQAMKDKDYDAVDALIDSSNSLPKSALVGATERTKDMEKLADMKEAGLSSAKVYYQFTDDMKTIYEGEERTDPRASDYIRVAGSGKYSDKDADAIMNYERKVSKESLDKYQRQIKYQLKQAGKSDLNDEVWRRIELVANGKQDKDVFKNWIRNTAKDPKNRSGISAKQGEEIIDIMTNYTSDNHVAGVYVTAFYNAARSIGCSPKQALQFYDHIDNNYNKSYSKSEIDQAVAWAFGYDSKYKKKYYGNTYTYYNFSGQAKKVRDAIKNATGR